MKAETDYIKVASYEGKKGEVKKVVLLYSGGLDTSVMLKWIQDKYKAEVIALTLNLGQQGGDPEEIKQKALKLGAKKAYVIDVKEEFANDYLAPLIKANGSYQGDYHISTVSRYLMAKWAVVIAYREKADAIGHGCTGKGNDQVRIDSSILTLAPSVKIIAPVREWDMTREVEIEYAKKNKIPVPASIDFPYSDDDNMWGMTWEGGEVEDPSRVPHLEKFQTASRIIEETPDKPEYITLEFKRGLPIKLNDKRMTLASLIVKLNKIAGKHGVGVVHHLEDRLVGLKTRGVYEHPGAHTIIEAHRNLEKYVCTRLENELKAILDIKWGYLCYCALWFDPVMDDINAFNNKINEKVEGKVKIRLFKGHSTVVSVKSPHGLHHATFMKGGTYFNVQASAPFIEIYSMQMRLAQQRAEKNILLSIGRKTNKKALLPYAKKLAQLGFKIYATKKTHQFLTENGVTNFLVYKISQRKKPNLKDLLDERRFDLIINIPSGRHLKREKTDGRVIRKKSVETEIKLLTDVEVTKHFINKLYQTKFGNLR